MRLHRTLLLFLVVLLLAPSIASPAVGQGAPPVTMGFVAASGADFAAMKRAGASAVKLIADWSAIEPARGTFSWEALDRSVSAASSAGLAVTLVLAYTPRWASIATGLELRDPSIYSRQPPKRVADWQRFVSRIATRYKDRVKDWQIWTAVSLPIWRGTATDYLALVRGARAGLRAAGTTGRVVLATPLGIDLISIRRAVMEIPDAFDAISLAPRGIPPEALFRPLTVLSDRILAKSRKRVWIEWDPRGSDRAEWSSQMVKVAAIARALGVDRIDWAMDPSAASGPLDLIATQLGPRVFAGHLAMSPAVTLVYGDASPVAVAWSAGPEVMLQLEGENLSALTLTGETKKITSEGGKGSLSLGGEPLVILGLAPRGGAAIAKGVPEVFRSRDFSEAAEVSARLGRTNVEEGLYNMPFRSRRNGAVEVVDTGGGEAVRTSAGREIVFVYFDVDDSFLYYVDGRYGVDVTVEVRGASAPQQLGFNLLYDSMTGYRFTPWHWVEVKDDWVTYTFRLPDAAFANTWGWDFAINAAGNRREDLTIRSVVVRKISR